MFRNILKKRLLLPLLAALLLEGCGLFGDDYSYYWTGWNTIEIISIFDDSLAVIAAYNYRKKTWEDCNFVGCIDQAEIVNSRVGLFLVNYRTKQDPLLGSILDNDLVIDVAYDYFRDSSVLVFDNKSRFGFWKIGEKTVKFDKYDNLANYNLYNIYRSFDCRARYWLDDSVLLMRKLHGSVSLFLLDTKSNQIKSFEFSGERAWLSECRDMSYIDGKIVCVRENSALNNFELVVNNRVVDTDSLLDDVSILYGNYLKGREREINGYFEVGKIYKINTQNFTFDNTFIPIWFSYSTFHKDSSDYSNVIRYSPKDLNLPELK